MVARAFVSDSGKDMDEFYNEVLLMVDGARSFYVEGSTDKYSDAEFAEMMLLDGCLILAIIESMADPNVPHSKYKETMNRMGTLVFTFLLRDMFFLLENQLPFDILQLFMRLKFKENNMWMKIIHALLNVFISLDSRLDPKLNTKEVKASEHVKPPLHFLELLRKLLCKPLSADQHHQSKGKDPDEEVPTFRNIVPTFRSATELKAKGIHFRLSKSPSVTDMNFKSYCLYGQLELAPIGIDPMTKILLLNLVAYELGLEPKKLRITSYVDFMKSLIDHPDDVKELRKKHIIFNFLGSDEEVANVFKEINTFALNDFRIYREVIQRIEEHYNSNAKTWMAELIHKYFSSPWIVIAFAAGIFAVVLTFIQTYLAFFPRSAK